VRGDSLRDFYAKTLAVLGLGLLAGAGAVVDYWPVAGPVPAVTSAKLPAPAIPGLVQRLDQRIPAPKLTTATRPVVVRGTILAKNVGSARFLPAAAKPAVTIAAVEAPLPVQPVPQASWPTIESQWALLAQPVQEVAWQFAPAPAATAAHSGFIGGALRKTKDSIVKTGAVTGATIADAFRGVVGAFKKVSPF
jgi:hypothetical protein